LGKFIYAYVLCALIEFLERATDCKRYRALRIFLRIVYICMAFFSGDSPRWVWFPRAELLEMIRAGFLQAGFPLSCSTYDIRSLKELLVSTASNHEKFTDWSSPVPVLEGRNAALFTLAFRYCYHIIYSVSVLFVFQSLLLNMIK